MLQGFNPLSTLLFIIVFFSSSPSSLNILAMVSSYIFSTSPPSKSLVTILDITAFPLNLFLMWNAMMYLGLIFVPVSTRVISFLLPVSGNLREAFLTNNDTKLWKSP